MLFHAVKDIQVTRIVEEHTSHNFRQNMLCRARHTRIVEQMARTHVGVGEERVGKPAHRSILVKTRTRLKQLESVHHTAILILPSATCGQQLLEHKCTVAHFVLVPTQSAEIAQRTQYGCGQHRTGAQT